MKQIRQILWIVLIVSCVWTLPTFGASLTRGPYLQSGSSTSVVIRWRTDSATDSRVRYGASAGNLNRMTDHSVETTEHVVKVIGLSPGTKYYYSIGTTGSPLAGGDSSHYFLTSPEPGAAEPTRIWVIGDSGTADEDARRVRNAYLSSVGSHPANLWLMLGDNAYDDGTDEEYQAAVFEMYPTILRNTVLWPTFGNHDGNPRNETSPYFRIFSLPTEGEAGGLASGTEAYYSFNYGNIHFVCLESYSRSSDATMLRWLEHDLDANTKPWIIAFWHHPPYSKGSHDSDQDSELIEMRENALPILEAHGVDLVLCGHSHSYERSKLIDGHYGFSDTLTSAMIKDGGNGRENGTGAYQKPADVGHEGAVYAVAGCSGQTGGGSLDHPVMVTSLDTLGSMLLDIDGNRLDAKFIDSNATVRDSFTIRKGSVPATPDAFWKKLKSKCKQTCSLKAKCLVENPNTDSPLTFSVQFYLSSDDDFDSGDAELQTAAPPRSVKPGKKAKVKLKAKLPEGISVAGKFVIAIIHAEGRPDDVIVNGPLP